MNNTQVISPQNLEQMVTTLNLFSKSFITLLMRAIQWSYTYTTQSTHFKYINHTDVLFSLVLETELCDKNEPSGDIRHRSL